MQAKWLGQVEYTAGLDIQKHHSDQVGSGQSQGVILGLEHPAVVTLGRRFQNTTPHPLEVAGMPVVQTDRGGEMTLHSEGQLVVYPIIPLARNNLSVRDFVCVLEGAMIQTAQHFGKSAARMDGRPGIYTPEGKLGFVGIRVKGGVTSHGLSFNVNNDLSLFSKIISCGVQGQAMDRLAPQGGALELKSVFDILTDYIQVGLGAKARPWCGVAMVTDQPST